MKVSYLRTWCLLVCLRQLRTHYPYQHKKSIVSHPKNKYYHSIKKEQQSTKLYLKLLDMKEKNYL